jgi:hypothetical protein
VADKSEMQLSQRVIEELEAMIENEVEEKFGKCEEKINEGLDECDKKISQIEKRVDGQGKQEIDAFSHQVSDEKIDAACVAT